MLTEISVPCYTSPTSISGGLAISTIQLQINEVARRAKVSIRTVRFYEEKGIFGPSARTSGGIRLYSQRDVNELVFIRRLAVLGLSLEEIGLCLGTLPEEAGRQVRAKHTLKLLKMQAERLTEEQAKLDRMKKEIDDSVERARRCLDCRAGTCPEHCPSYGYVL